MKNTDFPVIVFHISFHCKRPNLAENHEISIFFNECNKKKNEITLMPFFFKMQAGFCPLVQNVCLLSFLSPTANAPHFTFGQHPGVNNDNAQ